MPKQNNTMSEAQIALLAAAHQQASPQAAPTAANSQAERLFALLSSKLAREAAAEEDKLLRSRAAQETNAKNQELRRQQEFAKQSQCPHLKPNRETALAGQRDHQGDYRFICQICSKEWTNGEVPNNLRVEAERVGGPNY